MTSVDPDDGELIRIDRENGIAWVTIDAPPMNLLGMPLLLALTGLVDSLECDDATRVVVIRSADPDFFIARGGGSEFCLTCDMRFAARGKAVFGQPEIALGILPGAGGTARLTRLLGPARASEIILGGQDFDADEAERYGWINRALPTAELGPFVERLARRIASFPALALAEAKRAIQSIADAGIEADLLTEQRSYDRLMGDPRAERIGRMERFLARGVQTREGERTLARVCATLGDP